MLDVKRIVQATTVVTAIALIVKGLGFVEKILLAYFFGTGIEVDAYLVAYTIPFSAYIVLREVIEPSFLPTFCTHAGRIRSGMAGGCSAWLVPCCCYCWAPRLSLAYC